MGDKTLLERQDSYKIRKNSIDTLLKQDQLKFLAERTIGLSRHSVMTAAEGISRSAKSSFLDL